jgi:hypothetical protein
MKRNLAVLAAVLFAAAAASGSVAARDAFAVSIGVPGVAVGYSTPGYGYGVAVPPVVTAPPAVYYGAYPSYYPGPVVYGRYWGYYGPHGRYHYWHR